MRVMQGRDNYSGPIRRDQVPGHLCHHFAKFNPARNPHCAEQAPPPHPPPVPASPLAALPASAPIPTGRLVMPLQLPAC
jgi:hypothetical protein